MIELLSRYLLIIVATVLTTYVLIRAGNYLPARLLSLVIILFSSTSLISAMRQLSGVTSFAYWLASTNLILLALASLAMLLLLSRLFTPEWWQGSRPIRWISLPYLLVTFFLAFDLIAHSRVVFDGIVLVDNRSQLRGVQPVAQMVLMLFSASWLVHAGVLISGYIHQPKLRNPILVLVGGLGLAVSNGWLFTQIPALASIQTLFIAMPVLGSLTYAVLRTRLFVPTEAAFDLAVAAINDPILVLSPDNNVLYANPAAERLALTTGRSLAEQVERRGIAPDLVDALLRSEPGANPGLSLALAGRQLIVQSAPVRDPRGREMGRLLLGRDVTELERRGIQLEAERTRLADTVRELEARERERDLLVTTVRNLALPVIPILDGVLVLPLVGEFDSVRAADLTSVLLLAIERERAHLVLLDITGVPILDTNGAAALLKVTQAASLLGARCTLVGIRPEIAQTLVALGVSFESLATAATLQQGLRSVLVSPQLQLPTRSSMPVTNP